MEPTDRVALYSVTMFTAETLLSCFADEGPRSISSVHDTIRNVADDTVCVDPHS